ncbi:MAG: hypothetical protein ACI8UO_001182 [Verrucomicrobiales bacterium]|jgi:hypothetical protein
MNPRSKMTKTILSTTLAFASLLGFSTPAAAQISGGTYGFEDAPNDGALNLDQLDEQSFRVRVEERFGGQNKIFLNGDFQIGAPEVHAFIFENDSIAIDTHDHFAPKFDGGDGPDYLVGSDAADSFEDWETPMEVPFAGGSAHQVRISIELSADTQQLPDIYGFATDLHSLVTFALDTMAVEIPANGLNSTGNEVAIFEDYGVSLKATGNEVAIVQSLDDRGVGQRWADYLGEAVRPNALRVLAGELDLLLWDLEVGIVGQDQIGVEIEMLIANSLLASGLTPDSVRVNLP